ncbi:MAG: RNA-binding S4 domain-containing protein [Betaproteobacteria bacterium]|nr:MAG: RNA-binding S4 domain-containing protein [Betaproteobacteria bacterium]
MSAEQVSVRLDKWLWAARFFKTRSIAADAAGGGKVTLNGERTKPAKPVRVGDQLVVRSGAYEWTITVLALSERRGPPAEAQRLYEETEQSRLAREENAAQLKAERRAMPEFSRGRPSKRDRRKIIRFRQDNN